MHDAHCTIQWQKRSPAEAGHEFGSNQTSRGELGRIGQTGRVGYLPKAALLVGLKVYPKTR